MERVWSFMSVTVRRDVEAGAGGLGWEGELLVEEGWGGSEEEGKEDEWILKLHEYFEESHS